MLSVLINQPIIIRYLKIVIPSNNEQTEMLQPLNTKRNLNLESIRNNFVKALHLTNVLKGSSCV
jgi:hypothetical protein